MEVNMIQEALKFMALGMGVVFLFLIIMIFVLKLQTAFLGKFFPEQEKAKANKDNLSATAQSKKVAAVIAAIQHHNNLKG